MLELSSSCVGILHCPKSIYRLIEQQGKCYRMRLLTRIWKSRKLDEHEMVMECMHGLLWHCPWSRLHFCDHTFLYFLKTQNFLAWRLYDWRVGNVICWWSQLLAQSPINRILLNWRMFPHTQNGALF